MGLDKSDLDGEMSVQRHILCSLEYNLGLRKGVRNGEVTLLCSSTRLKKSLAELAKLIIFLGVGGQVLCDLQMQYYNTEIGI